MRWLILGGRANGLAVARSLKQFKEVYILDVCKEKPVAAYSRYVKDSFLVKNDFASVSDFLNKFLSYDKQTTLVATDDWWVYQISLYRKQGKNDFLGLFPEFSVVKKILDKKSLTDVFGGIVRMPDLYPAVSSRNESQVIVKPRNPFNTEGVVAKGVNNSSTYEGMGVETLVQERLSAPITNHLSVCGISIDGSIYAPSFSRKLMEYPEPMGTATMIQSVVDASLCNKLLLEAKKVTGHIRYTGIFELEFIWDKGELFFIDFNPRFWLQHAMVGLIGVNYTQLYGQVCLDQKINDCPLLKGKDLAWVHEGAFYSFFKSKRKLQLIRVLFSSRVIFAHFDWSDMRPFWRFIKCKLNIF